MNLIICDIIIPASVYNCVLCPTLIDMQFLELKNLYLKIMWKY